MEGPRRSSVSSAGGKKSVSSQLIGAAVDLLALYNTSGKLNDPRVISKLCVNITRAIDHAIANNEVPLKSRELPTLLQKIDIWKHDLSVKKDTDDLLSLAYAVKRIFSTDDVLQEPCHALPSISKIMSRFYPSLKIKNTLCFTEVKPGYRTIVADFNLSRGVVALEREMIGMIVARVDEMDTSSCIITPQEVDILLNGKGVLGRNNTSMEPGPQLPTDVTAVLKYGVNLLQAIGNFNGLYIIVIAVMCVVPSSDTPLQDYVQPAVASGDQDTEMALQTSLNCPISKNCMRTPVKGHLCKHLQCFDYDNYLSINSRRPHWRCPLCDEPVFCSDMRIDQNVVKVIREVGENTVHVIISKDGSWKAVSEKIDPSFWSASKTPGFQEEKQNQSDPLRRNPSRDENYSQQISPTKDIGPSGVNNMHQITSNSSSLAANCTNLNDQGNKNPRIMDINPNGMSAAMSQMNDCRGCHSLQKGTELRNQPSWSCINTSSSANTLSSMRNSVSQVNMPAQNSNACILPTVEQNGHYQNSRELSTYQNLNSSSNIREAVRVQQVQFQGDSGIQASLTAQNIQPSVLVPCTEQPRPAAEQKHNMHEENNREKRNDVDGLVELPSEGWRPSGRMRGSLQGQAYLEAYRQFIKQPTQPVRGSELPSRLMSTLSVVSQVPVAKSQSPNTQASPQTKAQSDFGNKANLQGSSDCLP